MATTLVSFLGRGHLNVRGDLSRGYSRTTYRFPSAGRAGGEFAASVFGVALLRCLLSRSVDIDRWIVLGTSGSSWSELSQVLPDPDSAPDQYLNLAELAERQVATAQDIAAWERTLNDHRPPTPIRLFLTGPALESDSQQQIVKALFDNVTRGSDIVFDISNGFRHQPIVATFLVSLMRRTHDIRTVSFYSGVFEAANGGPTPVVELPICQRLLEATEAAAVLDTTGNYELAAQCLQLDAGQTWFLENTNQLGPARASARNLGLPDGPADPIARELGTLIDGRLQATTADGFSDRLHQLARAALRNNDYLRAVLLAYESLLDRVGRILYPGDDAMDYENRGLAKELEDHLPTAQLAVFHVLRQVRNACAHGTRPNRGEAQRAMQNPAAFRALLERAFALFEQLPRLLSRGR